MVKLKIMKALAFGFSFFFSVGAMAAQNLELGDMKVRWNHGSSNCRANEDPAIQVHHYNSNVAILRQNKCLNYEAPFMYLIFGADKAILFDTGATKSPAQFPLQKTVEQLLVDHYGVENRPSIELVVAHTHGHGDHVAGDAQFRGKPNTTIVGTNFSAVSKFYQFQKSADGVATLDLGGRILEILAIPGHEDSHIAVYDQQSGILLSGDTIYPGRLYVKNWGVYKKSVAKLTEFAESRELSYILGAHIEQSTSPGVDYPIGTTYQPDEHVLPLTIDSLLLLNERLLEIGPFPKLDVQADFIIYPT